MADNYRVIWTPTAKHDLVGIIKYISVDSVSSAKKVAKSIKKKAQDLTTFPERGRIAPELQNVGILTEVSHMFKCLKNKLISR